MKLYNPTLETIFGMHEGVNYYVMPMNSIEVSQITGDFLMEKFSKFGLTNITVDVKNFDVEQLKEDIPRRILEGMYRYVDRLNYCLNNWVKLDTDFKRENVYQTVLKNPMFYQTELKRDKMLEIIKSNEEKYGIKIKTEQIDKITEDLKISIDNIMKGYEKDVDLYKQGMTQQAEVDVLLKEFMAASKQ